ncbi:MAG: Ig-like domain-containing protein [Thermoplasmata archaeon]
MLRPGQVVLLSSLLIFAGITLTVNTGEAAGSEGHFLPPHVDAGLDTNGDGLFDQLVLNATVNATVGGAFVIDATLHDPSFALQVSIVNASFLSAGLHIVSLAFYGPTIAQAGINGPFDVELQLIDADTFSLLDGDTHTTAAYAYADFEAPPSFAPPHTDTGLDTDANGDFDFLLVNATVNITSPGSFLFRGLLRRTNTSLLLSTSNETPLAEGIQTVTLRFPGPFINVSGVDGPYTVDLRIFETESGLQFDAESHITAAYPHTDFDGPPVALAPPHFDFGLDVDGNGLFDFLVVNTTIEVFDAGSFEIHGSLHDANRSFFVTTTNVTNLTVGIQVVPLWFPGAAVNNSGVDGPYTVELSLRDLTTSATWDTGVHNTTAYSPEVFDGPPAVFAPPYSEFGLDTSGNGLFDYLVVNLTLQVFKPGTYRVFASLQFTPVPVGFLVENSTALAPGTHTIPLWFYGPVLGGTALEAIEVHLILHDQDTATTLDSDIHPTGPHLPSDFEGPESLTAAEATSEPVIDGVLSPGEWDDATAVNLTAVPGNQVPGWLLMKNSAALLFLAYDATGDTTENADDAASLSFDTSNDGILTNGREDQFVQRGTAGDQAHYVYIFPFWVPEDAPYDPALPFHPGLASAAGFGPSGHSPADHRTYEFAIPLALLGIAAEDTAALSGGSQVEPTLFDGATGAFGVWPGFTTGTFPLWAYADVLLTDLVPPSLILAAPEVGEALSTREVTVLWSSTDRGTGIDGFEVQLDGRTVAMLPALSRIHILSEVPDGVHTVRVVARDNAGNVRQAQAAFLVDATPPGLLVTSLGGPFWTSENRAEVTWRAEDDISGLDRFEIRLDGGPVIQLVSSARSHVFHGLAEGPHTVQVTAFDKVGNRRLAVDLFAVDTVPPTVAIIAPVQDAILNTAFPEVRWAGEDATSGIIIFQIRLDDRTPIVAGAVDNFTFANLGDGRHVLVVTARDLAGNAASASVEFTVDANIFSPTGPFGIFLLLNVVVAAIVGAALVLYLLYRRRRKPPL